MILKYILDLFIALNYLSLINGDERFYTTTKNALTSHIIRHLRYVSITSCQLQCMSDSNCVSIALPKEPFLGELVECFHLSADWDKTSKKQSANSNLFHILNMQPIKTIKKVEPTNLALGKQVTTRAISGSSNLVVDGDVKAIYLSKEEEDDSWIEIELPKVAKITKVNCYVGNVKSNILGTKITVDGQDCGTVRIDKEKTDSSGYKYYEVICGNGLEGKLVKLVKPGEGYISTNEVQVFGIYKT